MFPPRKNHRLRIPIQLEPATLYQLNTQHSLPMKKTLSMFTVLLVTLGCFTLDSSKASLQSDDLAPVAHEVVSENRTFTRDEKDVRYNVWTDDSTKAQALLKDFGITPAKKIELQKGQILAVFLNDHITEDLVQIVENKKSRSLFADYADSGIRVKLASPGEGKKYTHLTVVIFRTDLTPSDLGIRTMLMDATSEKK